MVLFVNTLNMLSVNKEKADYLRDIFSNERRCMGNVSFYILKINLIT